MNILCLSVLLTIIQATPSEVRIRELPTVSVSKDWWDRSSILFTGGLVVLGAVGACFALRTLKALERQTTAMIESQRPQVAGKPHGNPVATLTVESPRVEIELINRGLTPARDFFYESWIEILALPFIDFTESADHYVSPDSTVLYPQHKPLIINIPIRAGITEEQLRSLKRNQQHVCIRVSATYKDSLNSSRSVSLAYAVYADGFVPLSKYNWDR